MARGYGPQVSGRIIREGLGGRTLMPEARRELQEILGYIGWVQPGLKGGAVDGQ
jgi:hypothetical protein